MSDAQEFEQSGEVDMVEGGSAVEGRDAALPPWMEELPEPDIAFARTKGWSRPADLIRQYRDLETMVGPDQVRIPGEGATPVETEAFWSRLGRPATTDGYTFSPGESATGYDTGLADWFRDAAHEVNMPADMAEALHDRFLETRMEEAAAHWQADQARGAETAATLGREWGGAYDANLDLARRAVAEVGGDDLKEALEVSGMGNDPTLIRAFAGIGRRLYGGGTATSGTPAATTAAGNSTVLPMPNSASGAQREILRLRTDEKFMSAYGDRTHPSHEIAQAEMDALYAAAYPPVRS